MIARNRPCKPYNAGIFKDMSQSAIISILIPSRGRTAELNRCLNSLEKNTDDFNRVEVIIGLDFDDRSLPAYLDIIDRRFLNARAMIRHRSDSLSDDYYNAMARMSHGDIIWVLNDDCVIDTEAWDEAARQLVADIQSNFFYMDVSDTTRNFNNNGQFACFPMMSRAVYDALGYFFHPAVRTWGADKRIHLICSKAGCVYPAPLIHVIHHREASDETSRHMERVFKEDDLSTINDRVDFEAEAKRLAENIRRGLT